MALIAESEECIFFFGDKLSSDSESAYNYALQKKEKLLYNTPGGALNNTVRVQCFLRKALVSALPRSAHNTSVFICAKAAVFRFADKPKILYLRRSCRIFRFIPARAAEKHKALLFFRHVKNPVSHYCETGLF